jgi:hypothetical protein
MNDLELLDLIEKGETENILLQKDLTPRLNTLVAQGLVDICGGRLIITSIGKKFMTERTTLRLHNIKIQKDLEEFSSNSFRRNSIYLYLCVIILCTTAVFLSIIIMKGQ